MNITLAQIVPLINTVRVRINELIDERNRVAVVQVEKGESFSLPQRSVAVIAEELGEVRQDLITLEHLKRELNLKSTIQWDGRDICLSDALLLSKELQREVELLKSLGKRKKVERANTGRILESVQLLSCTTYEPDEIWQQALKLQRQTTLLSQMIERQNHFVEVEFDASKYLG